MAAIDLITYREDFNVNDDAEVQRDPRAPTESESDFWYDPHTIPQYDLLVRDGRVTQEEADMHRKGRAEMGLPMAFAELQPRPHRRFAWLVDVGGPSITGDGDAVELDGQRWVGNAWGTDDRPGSLNRYDHITGADDEYLHRELSKPNQKDGVSWEATYKVPGADKVYARVRGDAPTFAEALTAVCAVDFQAVQHWAGHTWYPNGQGWLAVVDGNTVTITRWTAVDAAREWRWAIELREGSVLDRMARLFGGYQFGGNAASEDAAIAALLQAPAQLSALAAELIEGNDAAEAFERGRQAGRAELKAQIFELLP